MKTSSTTNSRVMFDFNGARLLPGFEYKDHQRSEAV